MPAHRILTIWVLGKQEITHFLDVVRQHSERDMTTDVKKTSYSKLYANICFAVLVALFVFMQVPKIGLTPARENVFERQAQTSGMIRLYCLDSTRHPLASPQLPWGNGAFNMELSIFEWGQGAVARLLDGGSCESVERVSQISALLAAVASLFFAFLLGNTLFGSFGAILCAGALAFDPAWLKFSTYMLMDIRAVAFAFLGGFLCLKGRWGWATVAWFVAGSHRPQAFTAMGTYFVLLLGLAQWMHSRRFSIQSAVIKTLPVFAGGALALCYHAYAAVFNRTHDLPWFTWAGPRIFKTYFGNWHERWEWPFWKGLLFDWLHKPALNLAFAAVVGIGLILFLARRNSAARTTTQDLRFIQKLFKNVLILSLPYVVSRFVYTFMFLTVFKWHDYYAVPLNGLGALTKGLILGSILQQTALYFGETRLRSKLLWLATAVTVVPLGFWAVSNVRHDLRFTAERRNPGSSLFYHDWGQTIFPADRSLVVVVHPLAARDMGYLYISKHPGYTWCKTSPENAPRAFWRDQGVKYVAWPEEPQPNKPLRWTVRTMAEELAHARARGWSSDLNDFWAGRTMAEWAKIASRYDLNPCQGGARDRDPRLWKD